VSVKVPLGLERKVTHPARGTIIWVDTKYVSKPFPTKIGTWVIKYA
jgi:hypothetical protein